MATRTVEEAMTDVQVTMSWAKTNDKDKHIVREGILIQQAKRQHVESDDHVWNTDTGARIACATLSFVGHYLSWNHLGHGQTSMRTFTI